MNLITDAVRTSTIYGRAATKVRRCPPEGVAGLSKLRGCPREGVVGHVTEGFTPLGKSINRREGRDTYLVVRSHVARDLYFYLNYTLLLFYYIYYFDYIIKIGPDEFDIRC